jgi:hypothetical protein
MGKPKAFPKEVFVTWNGGDEPYLAADTELQSSVRSADDEGDYTRVAKYELVTVKRYRETVEEV